MTRQARPEDLEPEAMLTTGSRWVYRADHGREDLEAENYFVHLQGHLAPMDRITVYLARLRQGSGGAEEGPATAGWDYTELMVLVSEPGRVVVECMGYWRGFRPAGANGGPVRLDDGREDA